MEVSSISYKIRSQNLCSKPFSTMQDASKIWQFGTRLKDELRRLQEQKLKAAGEIDQRVTQQRTRIAFDDAKDSLIDQLAHGDLLAAGRLKNSKNRLPQLITAEYWIGVEGFFPEMDQARSRQAHYNDIKVIPSHGDHREIKAEPDVTLIDQVADKVPPSKASFGGRPNQKKRAVKIIREMIETRELYDFPDRTLQAREVRVRLLGDEGVRYKDNYPGLSSASIARWIGEEDKH